MTDVLLLVVKQGAAALALVAAYLGVAKLIGPEFYRDAGLVFLVFGLTALVFIGAVWGVFVRPWWVYLIASGILGLGMLLGTFWLIDVFVPGTLDKIGPGGTVFLLPMLAFFFLYPASGMAQWVIGMLTKNAR